MAFKRPIVFQDNHNNVLSSKEEDFSADFTDDENAGLSEDPVHFLSSTALSLHISSSAKRAELATFLLHIFNGPSLRLRAKH